MPEQTGTAIAKNEGNVKTTEKMNVMDEFESFSNGIVTTMQGISKLADKRASTFLFTIGTALLVLIMFWRLKPGGIKISDLQPSEFITMAILSAFFVWGGAFLRVYQERLSAGANKEIRDTGVRLIETAASLVKMRPPKPPIGGV